MSWKDIWLIAVSVLLVVTNMVRHFDDFIKALPSLQKFFTYAHKRWFRNAIFRADVLTFMNTLQLQMNLLQQQMDAFQKQLQSIEGELKHNGGSTVKDAVSRMEAMQKIMIEQIEHLKALRDISDKYDPTMKFKFDPEQGVTFISESFLDRFGHHESDVMFYGYAELIYIEDRASMWDSWKRAIEKKTPFIGKQRIVDSVGIYHQCDLKAQPIIINNKIREFVGVIELSSL